MIKALVFDLDDTLYPEIEYVKSGFRHVSKIISNLFNRDENIVYIQLERLFDLDSKNVFNRWFDENNVDYTNETIQYIVSEYRKHKPIIMYYDDVLPTLTILKEKKLKTGIITDGYALSQKQKLEALKAYEHFDEIIITDEFGKEYWKPSELPFKLISERLDVYANEMVYVGDNPAKDFFINSILPIITVRINRDGIHKNNNYLNDVKENYKVNNLLEIWEILNI
ncbi:MAG: HAD-IA family hydrolase [Tissierellales bacterium]|nr:HAD-IA family hydrolase [Tissierellales bacterium]